MTDTKNQDTPATPVAPISLDEIKTRLEALFDLVPSGGSRFGISRSVRGTSMSTMVTENDSWRIDVTITVPRRASLLFAYLASWKVKGSTRTIKFVLRADASSDTTGSGDGEASQRFYTVLNGDFPNPLFSRTEPVPQDFRDEQLRNLYGSAYATTDFERALRVIRSELTGEKAFDDPIE